MTASSLKNTIITLTISALISGVKSQLLENTTAAFTAISRDKSTSPTSIETSPTSIETSTDCLTVINILQQLGQAIETTDCRSIAGVTFSGSSVTKINFNNTGLVGSIPHEIGNLQSLTEL